MKMCVNPIKNTVQKIYQGPVLNVDLQIHWATLSAVAWVDTEQWYILSEILGVKINFNSSICIFQDVLQDTVRYQQS